MSRLADNQHTVIAVQDVGAMNERVRRRRRTRSPPPGRFVIAPDGTILYAEINPDYTTRPEPDDMLPALRQAANVTA